MKKNLFLWLAAFLVWPVFLSAQTLTEIYVPQYMVTRQAVDGSKVNLPFVFRVKLSGLSPNLTYRYYVGGVSTTATSTTNGTGNTIVVNETTFRYATTGNLGVDGRYGEFTTDNNGEYTGWFAFDPNGGTTSYYQQNGQFRIRFSLNDGNGGSSVVTRITTASTVTSLYAGSDAQQCTGIRSTAVNNATPKNFVLLWSQENPAGGDRPVAGTYLEDVGIPASTSSISNNYPLFYKDEVIGKDKTWGSFIPNNLAGGIKKIAEYSIGTGAEVNSKTSADGTWPGLSGAVVNTVNASGGTDNVLVLDGSGGSTTPKTDQSISFPDLPTDKKVGDADFPAGAQASSGLPVSYTSSDENVAKVIMDVNNVAQVHITGRGTATITATQPGDAQYNAAPPVSHTLTVNGLSQTISFTLASPVSQDDADILLNATSSASLPVSYASSNTSVATIVTSNGNYYLHLVGNGTVTITASQNGDATYNPATPVDQQLEVTPGKKTQTLSLNFTGTKTIGDADFPVNASSDAGLTNFTYSSSNPAVASIDATGMVHIFAAGTTDIIVTEAGNSEYKTASITQTLTVNKAAQSISFSDFSGSSTYGDAPLSPGITSTGNAALLQVTSSNTAVATVAKNALGQWEITLTGAGTADITASQPGDDNYEAAAPVTHTLTVNKAALQIIAENKSKLPNTDNPPLTYHINGWVGSDGESLFTQPVTLSTTADKNSPVGSYPITIAQNLSLANYTISYTDATLTISNVAFSAIPAKVYGDAPFNPGATAGNGTTPVYSSDNAAVAVVDASGNIVITGAGTAHITATFAAGNGFPEQSATELLTVNKKPVAVTVDNASRVYGQNNPAAFSIRYNGFVNGETESVLTTAATATTAATNASPAGSYVITVSGAAAANYTFTYTNGVLTVGRATLQVTADNKNKTYGPAPLPVPTYSISGWVLNDNAATVNFFVQASHTAQANSGAGTYAINITGAASTANYNILYTAGTLTIDKAPLTITANNQVRSRGEDNPPLTVVYSGFVNGDDAGKLSVPVLVTTTAKRDSPAGNYDIVVSNAASPNYNIQFVNGVLTVNNAQIITWYPFSAMVYGDAAFNPGAVSDAGVAPVYSTDNPAVALVEGGKLRITGAGTATITATFPASADYPATRVDQKLTVQKKSLIIAANNLTKNLGEPNPLLTASYTGFVNGDTNTVLITQPQLVTTAGLNSPVGNYPITVSGAAAANYNITYVPGNLSVVVPQQPNSISFGNLAAKAYGSADFNPGAVSSAGLPVSYTSSNTAVATIVNNNIHITGVGTANITASQPGDATHIAAENVTRTLVVTKAVLTISVDSAFKLQGEANPPFLIRYSGFAAGDDSTVLSSLPAASTTATKESLQGVYTVVLNGNGTAANYALRYSNGVLTILPPVSEKQDYMTAYCSSPGQLQVNVFLQNAAKLHVQLFDLSGKRLTDVEASAAKGTNVFHLPVGAYAAGMYVVRVMGAASNLKTKVFIVH